MKQAGELGEDGADGGETFTAVDNPLRIRRLVDGRWTDGPLTGA